MQASQAATLKRSGMDQWFQDGIANVPRKKSREDNKPNPKKTIEVAFRFLVGTAGSRPACSTELTMAELNREPIKKSSSMVARAERS